MIVLASLFCCALECAGATFQVTTNLDFNAGSLRQAITDANATPGTNTITFNIPGSGVQTISVSSQLPVITNTLVIDGTTQPGYTGTPLIALNGNGLFGSACGLVITGTGNTVRALSIQRFHFSGGTGHGILIQGGGSNIVAGCFIGVDATGTALQFNSGAGIWISNSVYNVIGGTNAADRNLICGNSIAGVLISGGAATNNQVLGNYIGLGIFGTNVIGSTHGVTISNTPNNIIGGTVPGARNVISGQSDHEVILTGTGTVGNVIAGNYIGIRADGTALSANNANFDGISVNNAPSNTIGGIVAGARNVISGNNNGINLLGSNTVGNVIQGNYIGTDASGSVKIPNHTGVIATALNGGFSVSNVIGGSVHGAGNLISGNVTVGVYINGSAGNTVQGNFIGTDATGLLALGNGASGTGGGLSVSGSGNIIGGAVPGAGNVISGNPSDGLDISVASISDFSINNLVQGNFIGVGSDGTTPLGNGLIGSGGRGLAVLGANSNLIGGFTAGSGNVVAYNGLDGVWLVGTFGFSGLFGSNNIVAGNTIYSNGAVVVSVGGNAAGITFLGHASISSNSIFANTYLGIDRGGDGPTPNTPGGPSNYPILTSARQGSTDIDGVLDGTPGCTYTIEFYENFPQDIRLGNYGPQGHTLIGKLLDVPPGPFEARLPGTATVGDTITAFAESDCGKDPSEFSATITFTAAPNTNPPTMGDPFLIGALGTFTIPKIASTNGRNIAIQASSDPKGPYRNVAVIPAMQTQVNLDQITEILQQFYRLQYIDTVGKLKVMVQNPGGSPMSNAPVKLGRDDATTLTTGTDGSAEWDDFPDGDTEFVLEEDTTVTGTSVTYSNKVMMLVNVAANISKLIVIQAMIAADTNAPPPACNCTPWCGIVAGVVDGVEQLEARGGANGTCGDSANVQITPPVGAPFTLPPGQTLFDRPPASGTWTITSTVCGRTQTATITVP